MPPLHTAVQYEYTTANSTKMTSRSVTAMSFPLVSSHEQIMNEVRFSAVCTEAVRCCDLMPYDRVCWARMHEVPVSDLKNHPGVALPPKLHRSVGVNRCAASDCGEAVSDSCATNQG